jgi:hypothetical protein
MPNKYFKLKLAVQSIFFSMISPIFLEFNSTESIKKSCATIDKAIMLHSFLLLMVWLGLKTQI